MSQASPQTIVLDETNTVQLLVQYIDLAQQKGSYLLSEAELLKRASDVLLIGATDSEVSPQTAKTLLVQGVHKAQRHGAYNLNDAALLSKVVTFVTSQTSEVQNAPPTVVEQPMAAPLSVHQFESDDLADLAEPIPLKPKEV
jgi:hypothetical protein